MANYFYAVAGQQQGPIAEEQLDQMVATGTLPADALVWREGMANWQPYSVVKPQVLPAGTASGGGVTCSMCRQTYPPQQIIQYGATPVCTNCNPQFLANLPAGAMGFVGGVQYAGFWRRLAAKFIDGVVLGIVSLALLLGTGQFNQPPTVQAMALQNMTQLVIAVIYGTFCLGKWGATAGKMALGLRVITADGRKVDYVRAFGRTVAEWLSGCTLFIGYIIAAFDPQKRALHDHLAGTRVIVENR